MNFDSAAYPDRPHLKNAWEAAFAFRNPNSNHADGDAARAAIADSKTTVRSLVSTWEREQVEFLPGGGSVVNQRVIDALPYYPEERRHLILISGLEHRSISVDLRAEVERRGYEVQELCHERDGSLDLEMFSLMVREREPEIALISIVWVSHEIGVIQPIGEIISLARSLKYAGPIHSDASHAWTQVCQTEQLEEMPDLISFSLYKTGGPHLGLLLAKSEVTFLDRYYGTPDATSIVAASQTLYYHMVDLATGSDRMLALREQLRNSVEKRVSALGVAIITLTPRHDSVPNIITFLLPRGFEGKRLQRKLSDRGLMVSSGSACSSESSSGSPSVVALGFPPEASFGSIRFSFSADRTSDEVEKAAEIFAEEVAEMKKLVDTAHRSKKNGSRGRIESEPVDPMAGLGMINLFRDPHIENGLRLTEGEQHLKGDNRRMFRQLLERQVRSLTEEVGCELFNDDSIIDLDFPMSVRDRLDETMQRLQRIPGVAKLRPGIRIPTTDADSRESLVRAVVSLMQSKISCHLLEYALRFKIVTRSGRFADGRAQDWAVALGRYLDRRFSNYVRVNLRDPMITFNIRISEKSIFISTREIEGEGGLPVGSLGIGYALITQWTAETVMRSAEAMATRGVTIHLLLPETTEPVEAAVLLNRLQIVSPWSEVVRYTDWKTVVRAGSVLLIEPESDYPLHHRIEFLAAMHAYERELGVLVVTTGVYDPPVRAGQLDALETLPRIIHSVTPGTGSTRGIVMLSGGIDSPVAGAIFDDLGYELTYLHFASNFDQGDKITRLVKKIANEKTKLVTVHFEQIQQMIVKNCREEYRTMMYKTAMLKIAEEVAKSEGASFIVTGNSLGQVASQTLPNMINFRLSSSRPVVSPLIGCPKTAIITLARQLETYDISIESGDDSCRLFTPKHPVLKSRLDEIEAELAKIPDFMKMYVMSPASI